MLIRRKDRRGFSLLEVILAIAILGGALAVIFELVGLGMRSAMQSRLRSEANILCDTKMAEISAGVIDLSPVAPTTIAENSDWLFQADVQESAQLGLLIVTVTVEQASVPDPVIVSIVRFMPDPDYEPAEEEELQ